MFPDSIISESWGKCKTNCTKQELKKTISLQLINWKKGMPRISKSSLRSTKMKSNFGRKIFGKFWCKTMIINQISIVSSRRLLTWKRKKKFACKLVKTISKLAKNTNKICCNLNRRSSNRRKTLIERMTELQNWLHRLVY